MLVEDLDKVVFILPLCDIKKLAVSWRSLRFSLERRGTIFISGMTSRERNSMPLKAIPTL